MQHGYQSVFDARLINDRAFLAPLLNCDDRAIQNGVIYFLFPPKYGTPCDSLISIVAILIHSPSSYKSAVSLL